MKQSLAALVESLVTLPGIGRKTAQRIAFFLLRSPDAAAELAASIQAASSRLHACPVCFGLTEEDRCDICSDLGRDRGLICVVEEPADVLTIEQSGQHRGVYHVLGGVLSPIDDIGPDDLRISELVARANSSDVAEVIIATNPTTEGEATAVFVARQLKPTGTRITRIARGLPVGSDLDLADGETLGRAFEGRREVMGG